MAKKHRLPKIVDRVCGLVCVVIHCCLPLSGCGGSGNGQQAVSGVVTFQGNKIPDGSVQFCTDSTPSVVRGGAMIRDGGYQVPGEHGLTPGNYIVRITSAERIDNPDKAKNEMSPFFTRERIPAKYNTESQLKIEVRADKPTKFDFDLK